MTGPYFSRHEWFDKIKDLPVGSILRIKLPEDYIIDPELDALQKAGVELHQKTKEFLAEIDRNK